jgi:N-methylhydantoinase B
MNKKKLEPYLMSVLSSRLYSIGLEMTNTMIRAARSSVMSISRDLSTAICDRYGNVISISHGIPVHCANMGLTVKPCFDHPEGIHKGDLFLNNSPYFGNTHHADYTFIAPVFYGDTLMFFAVAKGHQADCGNTIPSTYHATARNKFEEGAIDWPCIKIQKDYRDIPDIIAIAKANLRIPDIWYGDYLAAVGAARTGENRLMELYEENGAETIKSFCDAFQEYGEKKIVKEIKKLPAGHWEYDIKHDGIPDLIPEGVNIKIKCDIDNINGYITVDLRDNPDCMECGLNMSEATVVSSTRAGVLNRLSPDIPKVEGAMKHIRVLYREGCIIGKAVYPYSASVATTNLADRMVSGVQALFNQITEQRGIAEGGAVQSPAASVISGTDYRKGDSSYVNQIFIGLTGGPGINGHDGWVTYQYPVDGGAMFWSSIEVLERQYPFLVLEDEIIRDSAAPGKFDSAPSVRCVMTPRKDPVTFAYTCDGIDNVPKGANGGLNGYRAACRKFDLESGEAANEKLPAFAEPIINFGEAIVGECSGGGGYGDPLERNPELVKLRVREGWLSQEKAKSVYGVVLDTSKEEYKIDYAATEALRKTLKK